MILEDERPLTSYTWKGGFARQRSPAQSSYLLVRVKELAILRSSAIWLNTSNAVVWEELSLSSRGVDVIIHPDHTSLYYHSSR